MIDLVATLVLNLILFLLFKLFPRFGVNRSTAILVNYTVCLLLAILLLGVPQPRSVVEAPWLPFALAIGLLFILLFNLLARSTETHGMGTTTIANKLSLVFPALAGIFLFSESLHWGEIIGILLAIPALYLSMGRSRHPLDSAPATPLPLIIFFGSGLLDTLLAYTSHAYLPTAEDYYLFSAVTFATAATLGGISKVFSASNGGYLDRRSLVAGLVLGIPNYFSIYFLVRLLQSGWIDKSAAIPVNNMGIVLCTGLIGGLIFKENQHPRQWAGLALAAMSILWITLSDLYG